MKEIKKTDRFSVFVFLGALILMQFFLVSCERETVLIERTVNAVWSSDDSEILKVVSTYETRKPEEVYYSATSGKNWEYRFEICNPDLSECVVIGRSDDIDFGGILAYVYLYWLPKVQMIYTLNPLNKPVLKNMQGEETLLEPPAEIISEIFEGTGGYYDAVDIAPSPNEDVVAVFFQAVYLTDDNYTNITFIQCISFFNVESASHIATYKIDFDKVYPQLQISYPNYNKRCAFLWSKNSSGVYVATQNKAYFIGYGTDSGIVETDSVPERPTKTNSGKISNTGKLLRIAVDGNSTSLDIVQLDDWKPFDSLELIPTETNTYSLY